MLDLVVRERVDSLVLSNGVQLGTIPVVELLLERRQAGREIFKFE